MRPGPLTLTTQRLLGAQRRLQPMGGLLWQASRHRHTPDGFSRELKAEVKHDLLLTALEVGHLSAWLPRQAPNDPPASPGAA